MERLEISFCNSGANDVAVWLEPWAEEFILPPRGELALQIESDEGVPGAPEFEATEHGLAIYADGGTRVAVAIDGVPQDSASAIITSPNFGALTAKGLVDAMFADFPETRPHGAPAPVRRGWFQRLFGLG